MNSEYFDVIIIGAGLSGIGAAYHLQTKCPRKSYVILERRDTLGGTWDLFRYPGIRSDSDMHTLGYNFKPWKEAKAIADGQSILQYVGETATENQIDRNIRYNQAVKRASWSSEEQVWTIETQNQATSNLFQCNFLLMCSGYYRYDQGYTPDFPGGDRFQGKIVHPQKWQQDLNYTNQKVIVIGSGATAVTLVPELAKKAAKVIMLQRSPTYIVSRGDEDKIANFLHKLLPSKIAYAIVRWKNIKFQQFFYQRTRSQPEKIKHTLIKMVRQELGSDYDVEQHFTPRYNPWDQRLCLVPNGDLFQAIKSGKAEVITEQIDSFTEQGILLKSGQQLSADVIVTATGLNLLVLGGVEFLVDGQAIEFNQTYTYKGIMYSGIPNLVSIFGYINAPWTLRADLISEYVCRLLEHLERTGTKQCTPRLRDDERGMVTQPFITGFSSGYIQRILHLLPKQGDRHPWLNVQNYHQDKINLRHSAIEDGILIFE